MAVWRQKSSNYKQEMLWKAEAAGGQIDGFFRELCMTCHGPTRRQWKLDTCGIEQVCSTHQDWNFILKMHSGSLEFVLEQCLLNLQKSQNPTLQGSWLFPKYSNYHWTSMPLHFFTESLPVQVKKVTRLGEGFYSIECFYCPCLLISHCDSIQFSIN